MALWEEWKCKHPACGKVFEWCEKAFKQLPCACPTCGRTDVEKTGKKREV